MAAVVVGLFRGLAKGFARRAAMRAAARKTLQSSALKQGNRRFGRRSAELVEEIAELTLRAEDVIEAAFYEAMDLMFSLTANPGQESAFDKYVLPEFAETLVNSSPQEDWPDVNIGEYMSFMGEIVAEGNAIMSQAYEIAQSLYEEIFFIQEEIENFNPETGEPL